MKLSSTFQRRITDVYGPDGTAWLRRLPALLRAAEERWEIRLQEPFPLSYNYVAPALRADGGSAVVKAGFPPRETRNEIAALRHFDGHGSVRLIDADPERGLLLLERIEPGTALVALHDDDAATAIAAAVMRALSRPPDGAYPFPTVGGWAARFAAAPPDARGPLPARLVAAAEAHFQELLASSGEAVVLHGDLHHGNVLDAGGGAWVCIDPKGVIGERAYEAGALLRNPLPGIASWPDLPRILARRVDRLSEELGIDRARIVGWGVAQAVLSAFWSYEDHGRGWEPAIAVAAALDALA
ncbi:MAG: aminoglycoside phosphotransferase family protein [Dehalococcoidia bacterium]